MRDALVLGRVTMSVLASVAKKLLAPWSAVGLVPPRTDRVDRIVEMPAWAASRLSSGGRLAGRARSSDEITQELNAGRAEIGHELPFKLGLEIPRKRTLKRSLRENRCANLWRLSSIRIATRL